MFRTKPAVVWAVVDRRCLSDISTRSVFSSAPIQVGGFASPKLGSEITMVLAGSSPQVKTWTEEEILAGINERKSLNIPPAQIASQLSAESNWPRRKIYQMLIEME